MRSCRHEARRELIGKICGPWLWACRVKAVRNRVEVYGQTVLFGEDLCVAIVEGMVYLGHSGPFSAVYSISDLKPII